jgi:hypothetical protein
MKVRSLKQALHWLFLAVGALSLVILIFTASTYFSYAKEGYGLDCRFDRASLDDAGWLMLRFYFENPGDLDIVLLGGNLTLASGGEYQVVETALPNSFMQTIPLSDLPARENTSVMVWFQLDQADFAALQSSGLASVRFDMDVYVPMRHANTHLRFENEVEVSQ